ncbi:MAG: DUF2442 domain-containing protein [Candidatus Hatepunaea meridiana]|nr:DUF2442 domain-containing protein [Candidatus Hatepunaea meridiana]
MNTLVSKPLAISLRFNEDTMWLALADGRELGIPLAYFPRLLNATPEKRKRYTISGGGSGLHWDDLDEDILVENLLLGIGDVQANKIPDSRSSNYELTT